MKRLTTPIVAAMLLMLMVFPMSASAAGGWYYHGNNGVYVSSNLRNINVIDGESDSAGFGAYAYFDGSPRVWIYDGNGSQAPGQYREFSKPIRQVYLCETVVSSCTGPYSTG